jgi:vacuolar-type H+-ATPase subunit E/Vma4
MASAAAGRRDAIERATGRRLVFEEGAFDAGCIARSADGRVTFDNTVEARERRCRTEWRAAVARLYDAAIAAQTVEVS